MLLLLLVGSPSASAADLAVGPTGDYPDLASALDVAQDGDVLRVDDGQYVEGFLLVSGKTVTIAAVNPAAVTVLGQGFNVFDVQAGGHLQLDGLVIDGEGARRAAEVLGSTLILDGVTVTAASGANPGKDGGAMSVTDSTLVVRDSLIIGSTTDKAGGHLYVTRSTVTIEDSSLSLGSAGRNGGAIWALDSEVTLAHTDLRDHAGDRGSVVYQDGGTLELVGGQIHDQQGTGSVIACIDATCIVRGTTFHDNLGSGALVDLSNATAHLSGAVMCGNLGSAPALVASQSTVTVTQSVLAQIAPLSGPLVSLDRSVADVRNNHVIAGAFGDGGISVTATDLDLRNNLVWANTGAGPVLDLATGASAVVQYNLFFDNAVANATIDLDDTNLEVDPQTVGGPDTCDLEALTAAPGSPLIDAGDPALSDADGSRSDIGAFGGAGGGPGSTLPPTSLLDADGDGVPAFQDCDDSDASVFPGAYDEADDGIDQNCSGDDASALLRGVAGCACGSGAPPGHVGWLALLGLLAYRSSRTMTSTRRLRARAAGSRSRLSGRIRP